MSEIRAGQGTEEAELIESWKAGDRRAGDELLRRHQAAVHRFFKARISCEPSDLVQETLVAATLGRCSFESRSSFKAYLLGIARFRLYEHYRKRKLDRQLFELDTAVDFEMHAAPSLQVEQWSSGAR